MKLKIHSCFLLINLLLSGSCSVSRKTTADSTSRQEDVVVRAMRDSAALSHRVQALVRKSIQVRHFTFSRPDSAGRQYVESAAVLSAATGETRSEQTTGEAKQTIIRTEEHARQSAEHTDIHTQTKRFPYWIAIAGLTAALYAILARGIRKT